jgi:hypothetical protein
MTDTTTHSPKITDADPARVKRETLAVIKDYDGHVEPWRLVSLVAKAFGHDGFSHPGDKFAGQVKRAANALVDEQAVRKVGRGERNPGSHRVTFEPHLYSHEAYAKAERRALAEQAADDEIEARWNTVEVICKARNLTYYRGKGDLALSLSLDTIEALLRGTST